MFTATRLLLVAGLVVCAGCYNSDVLLQNAQSKAVKTRLAEVDFGTFVVTLPRDSRTNLLTELKLRVFGNVARYRVPDVENQLKAEDYKIRAETLRAVRSASPAELAEPNLATLRERIKSVANRILKDAPVKSVGFYEVSLRQH